MASKLAFIQEWNDIVEYKMSENDLSHPTFEFFSKALDSLLRALNVNVDYMKENLPEGDEERVFHIRFCKHVNRLYKLNDPSFTFYFMDLINPTPKKSLHVLKMLLNYLKFYQMTKKEIINKANAHLTKYNEALRLKNELETKIEKNKKRAQKIERDLRDYETKMPEMKATIDTLSAQETEIDNEFAKKQKEIKNSEIILSNLETRENELEQRMVNENEYENYLRDIGEAEKELANLNQTLEFAKTSNMSTCRAIDQMEKILKEITALVDATNVTELEELVHLEDKLAKLKDEVVTKQAKIKNIAENEALVTAECKSLGEKVKHSENDAKKIEELGKVKVTELEKKIKAVQDQLNVVQIQRVKAEEVLHEEEETREYLVKTFERILGQIAAPFETN